MLPYSTERRRLLQMVRVFLHEFAELVRADSDGAWTSSSERDVSADHELERFLERLAVDAGQVDEADQRAETETDICRGIQQHLVELVQHASWERKRIWWN
jgi:hypothetical protein